MISRNPKILITENIVNIRVNSKMGVSPMQVHFRAMRIKLKEDATFRCVFRNSSVFCQNGQRIKMAIYFRKNLHPRRLARF